MPPPGNGWHLLHKSPQTLSFHNRPLESAQPHESLVATVMVMQPTSDMFEPPAQFPRAVKSYFQRVLVGPRFRLIAIDATHFGENDEFCASYELIQEEKRNALAPDLVLEITVHGFLCLEESGKSLIHSYYSERKEKGGDSLFTKKVKNEAEMFLKSIELTPLRISGGAS